MVFIVLLVSRSHGALIGVYDDAGNVIEMHQHEGEFKVVTKKPQWSNVMADCLSTSDCEGWKFDGDFDPAVFNE